MQMEILYISLTWMAFSIEFSGIVQGNAKDEDCAFVDTQPGFIDGQGLIFLHLQKTWIQWMENKQRKREILILGPQVTNVKPEI